jgi:succinate dehydrogenase / fumarate reductase cytochrome b subunit
MTDAPKIRRDPPVSPHLMTGGLGSPLLWRWHITMWTSILHRVTGVALYVGALIAAAWAVALAQGPDRYAQFKTLMGTPVGLFVMFGLTQLLLPPANGVRHPVRDARPRPDLKSANASAARSWPRGRRDVSAWASRYDGSDLDGQLPHPLPAPAARAPPRRRSATGSPERVSSIALVPLTIGRLTASSDTSATTASP